MLQSSVPAYILKDLLPHLTLQDICRCRIVSKSWNEQFKSFTQQLTSPQKPINLFVKVPVNSTQPPQLLKVITPCPSGLLREGQCEEFDLDLQAQVMHNSENDSSSTNFTDDDSQALTFQQFACLMENVKKLNLSWTHQIQLDSHPELKTSEQTSLISAQVLNYITSELTNIHTSTKTKRSIKISISLTLPYACQPFTTTVSNNHPPKNRSNINRFLPIAENFPSQVNIGRSLVSESMTIDLFHGLVKNLNADVLGLVEEVKWDGMPIAWWGDTLKSVFPQLGSVCVENTTGSAVSSILASVGNLERLQLYGGHRLGQVLRDVACAKGTNTLQVLRIRFCNGDQAITALMRSAVVENLNFEQLQKLELNVERGLWYEDVMCLNSTLPSLIEFSLGVIGIDHSSQIRGVLDAISKAHSPNLKILDLQFCLKTFRSSKDFDSGFLQALSECVKLEQLSLNVVSDCFVRIDLWPLKVFGNQLRNLCIKGDNLVVQCAHFLALFQLPLEHADISANSLWEFINQIGTKFHVSNQKHEQSNDLKSRNKMKILKVQKLNLNFATSSFDFEDSNVRSWHVIIQLVFDMYMLIKMPNVQGFILLGEMLDFCRICLKQMYSAINCSDSIDMLDFTSSIEDTHNYLYISRQQVLSLKELLIENTIQIPHI